MKTVNEEMEELIKQAKQDSLNDIAELAKSMEELMNRIFHFAYEAGYERGFSDANDTNAQDKAEAGL